ncbi:hypothetical protein MMC26_006508 [Xylographa opegraphella]|nr:hypothetical protein [Xylographa opegraphella]
MRFFQAGVALSMFLSISLAYDPRFAERNGRSVQQGRSTATELLASRSEPRSAPVSRRHSVSQRSPARVLSKEEMKVVLAKQRAEQAKTPRECIKVADCNCKKKAPGSTSESCLNGKCLCGAANKGFADITTAFAKPVFEGLAKAGREMQKVVGGLEFAVKMALQMASWAIPGLGKAAVKALNEAIPLTGTGDKKADEIMKTISKVL